MRTQVSQRVKLFLFALRHLRSGQRVQLLVERAHHLVSQAYVDVERDPKRSVDRFEDLCLRIDELILSETDFFRPPPAAQTLPR